MCSKSGKKKEEEKEEQNSRQVSTFHGLYGQQGWRKALLFLWVMCVLSISVHSTYIDSLFARLTVRPSLPHCLLSFSAPLCIIKDPCWYFLCIYFSPLLRRGHSPSSGTDVTLSLCVCCCFIFVLLFLRDGTAKGTINACDEPMTHRVYIF